ncbi:MAG: tetratricopeptide repeat protein [Desulfovibrio sp.]
MTDKNTSGLPPAQRILVFVLFGAMIVMLASSFYTRMSNPNMKVEVKTSPAAGSGPMGSGSGGPMGGGMDKESMERITMMMKMLEKSPDDPKVIVQIANTFMQMKSFDQALKLLTPAIEKRPEDADLLRAQGICLFELKKYDEAAHAYDKVIVLDPEDSMAKYNLGILYKYYLKNEAKGDELFEAVLASKNVDDHIRQQSEHELKHEDDK